jgi:hypothetical protein
MGLLFFPECVRVIFCSWFMLRYPFSVSASSVRSFFKFVLVVFCTLHDFRVDLWQIRNFEKGGPLQKRRRGIPEIVKKKSHILGLKS